LVEVSSNHRSFSDRSPTVWEVLASVRASVGESVYGQHDASWLSFYEFFRKGCNLTKQTDKIIGLIAIAESAGWALPHEHICWLSERPRELHRNQRGQLHCDGGPALSYPDGWSLYRLNGVTIPQWLAEKRADEIDCAEFAKIENAEVRREFVRKVGVERIAQQLGADMLDSAKRCPCGCDADTEYELLAVNLGGETGKWPYLKMRNPSIGVWHLEAVPKECRTVSQALNARNGGDLKHVVPIT